ncbi:MAG TPA: patatin-like phospholipase family protein [Longimicrobium sp.]|nr:patatin-like phospholipase family protein [Longimicrobium sp.]
MTHTDSAGTAPRKIGLALAGGVLEGGFYEIGVLCALEDAVEGLDFTRAGVYVGVSSGAILASLLANGVAPRTLSRAILSRAEDPLLNLNPDILFTPAVREYARRVGKLPGLLARWARRRIERPLDISVIGSLLELGALAPVGIFDSAPMERYLARIFTTGGRSNDFRRLPGALRVVAVKLDSSELVTFGAAGKDHVPISRAVQASISLPGLYCPVEIEGEHYIDGVARRTLNASVALDEGADLLFCVNPIVPVDVKAPNGNGARPRTLTDYGLPAVLSQTFRTAIHSRMGTGFRSYAHTYPDADVLLVEPELTDQRMFFSNIFSFSNRREVCEHAYARTLEHLRQHAAEVGEKLERHGMRLRAEVLDDPTRRLFRDEELAPPTVRGVTGEIREVLDRLGNVLDRMGAPAA